MQFSCKHIYEIYSRITTNITIQKKYHGQYNYLKKLILKYEAK